MSAGTITGEFEGGAGANVASEPGGMIAWRDPRLVAAMLVLLPVAIVAALLAGPLGMSADLLSVWVAGEFWQMGRADEIYAPAEGLFTMRPPEGWVTWLADTHGYQESIFPFLYPPLWAVVMGTIAPADFAPVAAAAHWINAGLLAATVILAIRASGALLHPVVHVVFVLILFFTTFIASEGFLQGQPHIFVAFLIVLAIERSRAGAGRAAGLALALAASIKIFPAAYAVIWLARGEKRALATFVLAGAALGAASILLAGWPLHESFLASVRQISRTLLMTGNNVSFDAVVGQIFAMDGTQVVTGPNHAIMERARGGWLVAERPVAWSLFANIGLVAVLAGSAFAARRMHDAALYAGLWPFFLTLTMLFTPTGWVYYVIPTAVFAPAMFGGLPSQRGASIFLLGFLMFFAARLLIVKVLMPVPVFQPFLFVAGSLVWTLGFALLARNLAGPKSGTRPI